MALEDIFRAYDIRGDTREELTPGIMQDIGRAYAAGLPTKKVVVGQDVRTTSPALADAFVDGLTSSGVQVLDAGTSPYGPVLFYGWEEGLPSAFITASHLPRDWNGVKFAHGNGIGYTAEENMAVRDRFFDRAFESGTGSVKEVNARKPYLRHLLKTVSVGRVKVLMDCGNGSSCLVAPRLFRKAGVSLDVIHGEPDGTFPNRESDVTENSLVRLKEEMHNKDYDIGIAYDGDADRVAAVDGAGRLLSSEQLAAVLFPHVAKTQDGPLVANVECSRMLEHVTHLHDRDVVRVRVGHTYLFKAMKEHDACLGVEKAGHMGVPHVLPLDDGIATSLYAAAVVSRTKQRLAAAVNDLPEYYQGRSTFTVPDDMKFHVIRLLQDRMTRGYDNTSMMDGIRVDFKTGWALIRASNTSPKIRLTVEAETGEAFEKIQRQFDEQLQDAIDDIEAEMRQQG